MARPVGSFKRGEVAKDRRVCVPDSVWHGETDLEPFGGSKSELLCQALECLQGRRGSRAALLAALDHNPAPSAPQRSESE